MDNFKNPIPYKARSVIYLVGLIVAAASIFIPALLLGTTLEPWIPTVTAVFGLTGALTAVLAKANLTQDDSKDHGEVTLPVEDSDLSPEAYKARMMLLTSELQKISEREVETEGYDADPVQYDSRKARREAEGS